jgi:uncharacterized protein (TIGR03437 family)
VFSSATYRIAIATVLASSAVEGQNATPESQWQWRRIGNTAIERSLADLASGPVNRVWYSATGSLMIQTASGRVFETADLETWKPSPGPVPAETTARNQKANLPENALPENNARTGSRPGSDTIYAVGKFAYRSETDGALWDNLTSFRGTSILGDALHDLAVSPATDDQIVVAGSDGVFRSMDGGKTWSGLNQTLPNLPASRLLNLPSGDQGVQLALTDGTAITWDPGEKRAWRVVDNPQLANELQARKILTARFGVPVTAISSSGTYVYLGMADGHVSVSSDNGVTWQNQAFTDGGAVERFWIDPGDTRVALAALGARTNKSAPGVPSIHVIRTQNGGQWDDITGKLPDVAVHGVTADDGTGAIYAATDAGVFMSYADLRVLGAAPQWTPVAGLNQSPVIDVKLDAQGNQLWAAVEGYGVYSTLAPHRLLDPRVVSTADLVARATAPGALVSVIGARVDAARAGDVAVPVLAASDTESQLQIPFELRGSSVSLAVDAANGRVTLPPVALADTSPAIFVDRDGTPVLLDADSGVMLDAMNPAHSRGRLQILATGLGRVTPDWPTGLAAPVENPPKVAAPVSVYLDRQPVEVTRAVLAPYIGFYLIELNVPKIVNYGPAELYLEVNGQASNRVRVYVQP